MCCGKVRMGLCAEAQTKHLFISSRITTPSSSSATAFSSPCHSNRFLASQHHLPLSVINYHQTRFFAQHHAQTNRGNSITRLASLSSFKHSLPKPNKNLDGNTNTANTLSATTNHANTVPSSSSSTTTNNNSTTTTNNNSTTTTTTTQPTTPDNLFDVLKHGRMGVLKEFAKSYTHSVKDGMHTTSYEIRLAARLVFRSLVKGHSYSRRDMELLRRTAKDVFRLLPFASFIMTTGFTMTYLVWARLFPFILPSHFRKSAAMLERRGRGTSANGGSGGEEWERLEAAREIQALTRIHLVNQRTFDHVTTHNPQLLHLLDDLQDPHATISTRDVLSFGQAFKSSLELDALNRSLLVRMAQFFQLETVMPTPVLRFQLHRILRNIRNDDKYISVEGVESLSSQELHSACYKRGLVRSKSHVINMHESDEVLKRRLTNWLSLSLTSDVPVTILVLYSAFKMQHETLEEEQLGPLEVRLRCLEEERDDLARQKESLDTRMERIKQDISEAERKMKEKKTSTTTPTTTTTTTVSTRTTPTSASIRAGVVWAEEMFTSSEVQHIRRVFRKAVGLCRNPGVALTPQQAAEAVSMINLRDNLILQQDVIEYLKTNHNTNTTITITNNSINANMQIGMQAVDEDDFVVMYASLAGRRWQPSLHERRRLALEQLEGMAARVELEAKEKIFGK